MLNSLKYLPLKLRSDNSSCTPVGPNTNKARPVVCHISGSKITLTLPNHRTSAPNFQEIKPKRDALDFPFRYHPEGLMPDKSWKYMTCLARSWGFWGPWFSGPKAELTMAVVVHEKVNMNHNASCFHPNVFESLIADFLTARYGHDQGTGNNDLPYTAPVNWQPIKNLPVVCASFDVSPYNPLESGQESETMVFLPVSNRHLVEIGFTFYRTCSGPLEKRDSTIDRKPILDLVRSIKQSINLELSKNAIKLLDDIKNAPPEMTLSESFPPLNWKNKSRVKDKELPL